MTGASSPRTPAAQGAGWRCWRRAPRSLIRSVVAAIAASTTHGSRDQRPPDTRPLKWSYVQTVSNRPASAAPSGLDHVNDPGVERRQHQIGLHGRRSYGPRPVPWDPMREQIDAAIARAMEPDERALAKIRGQNKLTARERVDLLLDAGSFVEDAPARQQPGRQRWRRRAARRRRGHRAGHDRRDAGRGRGQRPDGEGRLVGRPHGGEDGAGVGGGARRAGADLLAGRLGRRPPHRPGPAVPRSPRRRPDLLQPGQALGAGPADLLPVRAVGGRRRLHPVVLRHRVHGRGQRVDVPRLAADGRDGRRRDHHARGDGRRPDARVAVGVRRQPRARRHRRDRPGPRLPDVLPALVEARPAGVRERAPGHRARRTTRSRPTSGCRSTCTP